MAVTGLHPYWIRAYPAQTRILILQAVVSIGVSTWLSRSCDPVSVGARISDIKHLEYLQKKQAKGIGKYTMHLNKLIHLKSWTSKIYSSFFPINIYTTLIYFHNKIYFLYLRFIANESTRFCETSFRVQLGLVHSKTLITLTKNIQCLKYHREISLNICSLCRVQSSAF